MVILGWSGGLASRINLVPLQISETLQGWVPLTRRIAERRRPVVVPDSWCAPCAAKLQAMASPAFRTRLNDQRRSRLEGLFQRTIASTFVGLVAAAGLASLRHQKLAAIRESGHSIGESFAQDLLSDPPASARRRAFFPRKLRTSWRFPSGW
jgi:hypothetical protein